MRKRNNTVAGWRSVCGFAVYRSVCNQCLTKTITCGPHTEHILSSSGWLTEPAETTAPSAGPRQATVVLCTKLSAILRDRQKHRVTLLSRLVCCLLGWRYPRKNQRWTLRGRQRREGDLTRFVSDERGFDYFTTYKEGRTHLLLPITK